MTLFQSPTYEFIGAEKPIQPAPVHHGFALRDYQAQDADAVVKAWAEGKRGVICRHATGLGKSVLLAELARRCAGNGKRVLVVVDVTTLSSDLCNTIMKHTGSPPGVLAGEYKEGWRTRDITVATIQSLYAGDEGHERYRILNQYEYSTMLVDECETSIAEKYSSVIRYFMENPELKVCGVTATPFRGDKRGMAELYDYANNEAGTLNRDLLWSVMNGWLVKPRQAFVRCQLDFSTIKLKRTGQGDKDFSESDIANLLMNQDEIEWRKMAEAIHAVAKGQPSIVICPNSTEVARAVAHHLDGAVGVDGSARAIYGALGNDEARRLINEYKTGQYPYAVSVNMLYKGFDSDRVRYVFMLRKTRSRRLYEQAMGRGSRPLATIRPELNAEPDPAKRRAIIEKSDKGFFTMVDLVGVHDDAKDMGVIDILGDYLSPDIRRRTMKNMLDKRHDPQAVEEIDVGQMAREAQAELRAEKLREEEERARRKRASFTIGSRADITYTNDLSAYGGVNMMPRYRGNLSDKQRDLLIAMGCKPSNVLKSSKARAGAMIDALKRKGRTPDWRILNQWRRDNQMH